MTDSGTDTVYVATVDTYYPVMAVARTAIAARNEAARTAYRYLRDAGALTRDTDTLAKIIEYFGVTVTGLDIGGTGVYAGNVS